MDPIEQQLTQLVTDQKAFVAKANEELKNLGGETTETKTAIANIREVVGKMQTQLDAVDAKSTQRLVADMEAKSPGERFTSSERFMEAAAAGFPGRKSVVVTLEGGAFKGGERKTNITDATLGTGTSGVIMPSRLPGIAILAQQELRIRDIMAVRPLTTGNTFDWVKQSTRTNATSPQVEAAAKAESTYMWQAAQDYVRTIAHFTNVSRQALDDVAWLRQQIDAELMYGLKLKEESEILSGVGTGEHLNGLITQATAYDTGTYNQSGDTKLDKLRHAKLQARLAGLATYAPSAFILHPTDMHTIEFIKDQASNVGNYVIGRPGLPPGVGASLNIKTVWGLPVVESDSMTAGTFLVGSFDSAAELVDRMQATIEISFEHDQNFTKNLATILCEERIGLAVKKATAFIYGSTY